MVDEQEYHFFTSSATNWRTDKSLMKCIERQRLADGGSVKGFNIYKVPLPSDAEYKINNYAPEVKDTEFIHYEEY